MYKKILKIFLIILVFIYIIFEELIWEKFAKPLITLITKLQIFQNLIPNILSLNSYLILSFFIFIFIVVEFIGIYAGILLISGHFTVGIIIYALKIPLAAFIFWFFEITKSKLLEFKWFTFLYTYIILLIQRIKNSAIYIAIKEASHKYKKLVKESIFFTKSKLKQKILNIYKLLREKLKSF